MLCLVGSVRNGDQDAATCVRRRNRAQSRTARVHPNEPQDSDPTGYGKRNRQVAPRERRVSYQIPRVLLLCIANWLMQLFLINFFNCTLLCLYLYIKYILSQNLAKFLKGNVLSHYNKFSNNLCFENALHTCKGGLDLKYFVPYPL